MSELIEALRALAQRAGHRLSKEDCRMLFAAAAYIEDHKHDKPVGRSEDA